MEVCLWRILRDSISVCLRWICLAPMFALSSTSVYLHVGFFRSTFFSSAMVVVLVRWSFRALAR